MGCLPLRKPTSTFDPKSLQIDLASEISVIKSDERFKKSSKSNLIIHQFEQIPKDDPNCFIYFLISKFEALDELNLDDELDDGNTIETRKIDIDKKIFPQKHRHVKFSKNDSPSKHLSADKIKKYKHESCIEFSHENTVNRNVCKIDNIKEKSNFDIITDFTLHEGNFKSPRKSKFHHHHKKHFKSQKNKNYKRNASLSTIKSVMSDYDNELNNNKDG